MKRRRAFMAGATLLALLACVSHTPQRAVARPSSTSPDMNPSADSVAAPMFPTLLPLPAVSGTKPVPAAYAEGEEHHEQGTQEAMDENFDRAAEAFLKAARTLRVPDDNPHARNIDACRWVAYQNAWACFRAAMHADDGRARLLKAAASDPALADRVKALVR